MIQIIQKSDSRFDSTLRSLLDRETETDVAIENTVRDILSSVKSDGDTALLELTYRFDRIQALEVSELEIPKEEMVDAINQIDPEIKTALKAAASRIRHYHEQEVQQSWHVDGADGTRLGQRITALDRVGIYVPGGKAAYPSSVLMTAIPAKVAGVREIIMVVPTPDGIVNSVVIAAAALAGVDRIFRIGGAQAVAALAYGTETIPAVDKIVGPGNAYVATAKKMVFGKVGIDMIAGPSEVVVICDQSVDPKWVAMDLFAQAEHDELAQSIAITDSMEMALSIQQAVEEMLPNMERREIIRASLQGQGAIIVAGSLAECAAISNEIAPEHLELMVKEPDFLASFIQHAGAIFMGRHSAESLGDYCAGPNHVLPTSGTARFSSPLGVYDYQKRSSIIHASESGANEMAQIASILARSEGLTAHARSAEFRLSSSKGSEY